ncbi:hypothetical protein G9A89_006131 [Geosiphon pyriformis]|nr:hypothetical protein G9A89_006131 [Geosiphon pyriformis]
MSVSNLEEKDDKVAIIVETTQLTKPSKKRKYTQKKILLIEKSTRTLKRTKDELKRKYTLRKKSSIGGVESKLSNTSVGTSLIATQPTEPLKKRRYTYKKLLSVGEYTESLEVKLFNTVREATLETMYSTEPSIKKRYTQGKEISIKESVKDLKEVEEKQLNIQTSTTSETT